MFAGTTAEATRWHSVACSMACVVDVRALQQAEHAGYVRAGAPSSREQFYSSRSALSGGLL